MQLYGKSDIGLVRKSNQDNFAFGQLRAEEHGLSFVTAWAASTEAAWQANWLLSVFPATEINLLENRFGRWD